MDALIKRSIASMNASRKANLPWTLDQPWKQACYTFKDGTWSPTGPRTSEAASYMQRIAIYSWNIDFMLPHGNSRMSQALNHLWGKLCERDYDHDVASVIFLQECTKDDLVVIASQDWVRERFYMTDLDDTNWTSGHYGTVALIMKCLGVVDCFRVHYQKTNMERDVLFIDVALTEDDNVIRLGNSHLESMAFEPPMRPHQMALAASYMRKAKAAVIAGDFNAIQDFDRHLHTDNSLKDAYLELGGTEESEEGYTWGQQAATYQRELFGCCRMDKVFYCGGLRLQSFERFGADVMVEDQNEKADILALGFDRPWITDHLGVKAMFDVHSSEKL